MAQAAILVNNFAKAAGGDMKLYDTARAPNPRRVRIFLAEKDLSVPSEAIDLMKLEQKGDGFRALNPMQQTPALLLDDGTILTESVAICRYFDELKPEPPLFGEGILGRAQVEMWQRRIEFGLFLQVMLAFRHSHPAMQALEPMQIPELAEVSRGRTRDFLYVLDGVLAQSPFVAGERFSIADITALVAVDFLKVARIESPAELHALKAWHAKVAARPGAVP